MNRKYNILSGALLLIMSGGCFQSCQNEDFDDIPGTESLIKQGRYLTARNAETFTLVNDTEEPRPFKVGTPYRLLAFTKPYDAVNPTDETNDFNLPRFNKVAWEGVTSGGLRFINIESEPDKWFGFSALDGETKGSDGLVSLDFYGFTYGDSLGVHPADYIALDKLPGETTPAQGSLPTLKRTESVTAAGDLNDLMRGVLLNQNIATAGIDNEATQSVIPFRHCFSKLRFQISQQGDEDNLDADGNPSPSFKNLYIDGIEITGTYGTGTVYLQDGKVELSGGKVNRDLKFNKGYNKRITVNNTDVGDIIVFPSDGQALKNQDMPDGYSVGVNITVKTTERKDLENMLVNTDSPVNINTETDSEGTTWYKGTIIKTEVTDYYNGLQSALYFKQNTTYMLIIIFQKDAVRIITVIPQVEEWLPGEGTNKDPWADQELGQPQMFDNIVWSDRNLGADDYNPIGDDFERSVGYFYQSGRNIPYYPFKYNRNSYIKPALSTIDYQDLANGSSEYGKSIYRFFPIIDSDNLKMSGDPSWTIHNYDTDSKTYSYRGHPQMIVPESPPADGYYFDFMAGTSSAANSGLKDNDDQNMHWERGQAQQPVTGAWVIPSSKEFMAIFPSTPHAGNITFRKGGNNKEPMNWNKNDDDPITNTKTLRVTVPYYVPGMSKPTGHGDKYAAAWETLDKNGDAGTTHTGEYTLGAPGSYTAQEPNGDPDDGYASVYVISYEDGSTESLPDKFMNNNKYVIKKWGTIYAIKRVYTEQAYRMRWRVFCASENTTNPCLYIEICRYRCNPKDTMDESDYDTRYDWDHPAARLYFPICGLGDHSGEYINFGIECQYATSDAINGGTTSAVQIKITGNNAYNSYIAIVRNGINRNFGKQIRPIMHTDGK